MPDFIFPHAKTFRDPVYGLIKVPEFLLEIVDNPLFRRLRWISQMSLAQMVYPGAVHTQEKWDEIRQMGSYRSLLH